MIVLFVHRYIGLGIWILIILFNYLKHIVSESDSLTLPTSSFKENLLISGR